MGFASVEEIETRAKEQECQLWETILHDAHFGPFIEFVHLLSMLFLQAETKLWKV